MKVLRSRAEIEKRYVEQSIQLNKSWKMSAVMDTSSNNLSNDGIANAMLGLQKMNEDISGKEKLMGVRLEEEAKKIDVEVKKLETFLREMQINIKKLSTNKKKLSLKQQDCWKQWGGRLLDMIRILRSGKKPKGELYAGILLISESVELHCQQQRELAAGICQAWVGITQLEQQRIIILKDAILNTKDAFKDVYIQSATEVESAIEGIIVDQLVKKRMDIIEVIGETGRKIVSNNNNNDSITMENVFKFLEKEWDAGWEEIAQEYVNGKFVGKVMVVGKGKEIKAGIIVTVENYLVIVEEGKIKSDFVFKLEMAKCRVGEQGKAMELSEISTGIFSFPLKVIIRFELEEEAKQFHQLISGCVQNI
eukprot:TRINITY_DN3348_c0_g1_i3.p1 TRINITY_DN3348_c0_g1~~TRINITY_DN3348_c0_g1_i3.p1  ORF type:complete len:365 (-),score=57.70 TRINITY_DN3348_c0_g1_i3:73-1167(-)